MLTVTIERVGEEDEVFNHTQLVDAEARYLSLTFGLRSSNRIKYIALRNEAGLVLREWRPTEWQAPDRPKFLDK